MFEVGDRLKGFVRIKDVYYAPEIKRRDPGYDVVYYFFCRQSYPGAREYATAVIDLNRDEEALLHSFRDSTRKAIRRMLRDESLVIEIEESPTKMQVDSFLEKYDDFTRMKGFEPSERRRVYQLLAHHRIGMVTAWYEDRLLLQRILIEDTEKVLPYFGFTERLNETEAHRIQLISAVSKTVDYRCMLYWKEKGKHLYDLGGLLPADGDLSWQQVNHYKEGFHGEILKEYEFYYPLTWQGRLFCIFKMWLN
ncbi:hypothetical protein [Anoxynatronum buryatiense]|uniref:BioF2-like acetyltransferase domain-containing protein n=1 Tax=Anoxynatronum buryatiense TaxID=489973 RepID=A0AA46AIX4_9CLOT|nr:hypothetical protein [Anoxynatronum buryatiense]SMP54858.1 hypothetical protein SAMN06296020_105179 [Anoxynatronum buryatiense]